MLDKKTMTEQENNLQNNLPNGDLSPELRHLLEDELKKAELEAAIDAALEEGIATTREEVARMLLEKQRQSDLPQDM